MKRLALFSILALALTACDHDALTAPTCRQVIKADTSATIVRIFPDGEVFDTFTIKVDTLCQ